MQRHDPELPDHGAHTLRVYDGKIVGISGDDVFVEMGPRMQGVISRRKFDEEPRVGAVHRFTLRGQEESLWVLSLSREKSLSSWEEMESGSLVQARVVRAKPGGLEVKVGPLHAFMPASQTGLPREKKLDVLVGRNVTCEVIEVDAERQRIFVSRKLVVQRERESDRDREVGHLKPGTVIQGRVARIEEYGVFLRFGRGLEGLIHVSNLSHERVQHPSELVKMGDTLEAKVLYIRQKGKRIALGLKQMQESPWARLEERFYIDQIVEGRVSRLADFGAFVAIARGVEGLLHQSELGDERPVREVLELGEKRSVRIVSLDIEAERLSLSLMHKHGGRIARDEAAAVTSLEEINERLESNALRTSLGDLLRKAIDDDQSELS